MNIQKVFDCKTEKNIQPKKRPTKRKKKKGLKKQKKKLYN